MAKPAWKPWHEVVKLREDVRTGKSSLATFAADLYQDQLLQALIELAAQGSEERSLLEKISNHAAARGVAPQEELKL